MASGCDHHHGHHHHHDDKEKHGGKPLPEACGHTANAIRHALGHKHEAHDHDHDHDHHDHEGHHHGHSQGIGGHHHHLPKNFDRSFAIGATLNLAFVGAELTFGLMAHSMALMADAVHNFSDVIGLLMAWAAAWMGRLSPTAERTYGYRGASILAALGNAGLLFLATGAIAVESIQRFAHPQPVVGQTMIAVAAVGIAINAVTALLFWKGQKDDLNIRAAFIHMLGDAAISLGVVIAALAVESTGWDWIDPATSLVISVIIVLGSWDLAKEALHLSIDGVPRHINREEVMKYLSSQSGVTAVHDLHIWAMSTTETALTAHVVRPSTVPDDAFLQNISDELHLRFKINHATIQVEADNAQNCRLAAEDAV